MVRKKKILVNEEKFLYFELLEFDGFLFVLVIPLSVVRIFSPKQTLKIMGLSLEHMSESQNVKLIGISLVSN